MVVSTPQELGHGDHDQFGGEQQAARRWLYSIRTGDLEALSTLFRPDMVWHAQRLGTLSGDHVGREAVFAFFGQTMELTQGTFSVVPEEILASEATVAVIARSRARRGDRQLDDRQVHLFRLIDGQVAEVWQYTGPAADDFWA